MYNKPYPVVDDAGAPYSLKVVQADDYGSFWDRSVAESVLNDLEAQSKRTNTIIVVFIHGWHHNAKPDDPNLGRFKQVLAELHKVLDTPERARIRQELTGDAAFELTGLYIGWRGRSLPGWFDYLTLWGRKTAAERVGDGAVSEFIERLQGIYMRANGVEPGAAPAPRRFTGLVTIGHSLGAEVLWKSLYRSLEGPLVRRAPHFANILTPEANVVSATESTPISGLGDLNILINPAIEAYQFARVDALYRQVAYPASQTPQVVVFSSNTDKDRRYLFPLARAVTSPFRPRFREDNKGYQGMLWGNALGEVPAQLTHTLARAAAQPDSLTEAAYRDLALLARFDFTDKTAFGGVHLTPHHAPGGPPRTPYSPVMVVKTVNDIIKGHNDIFEPKFCQFLAKYIAFIEGKRIFLRNVRLLPAAKDQPAR
ncbi:MAG TPA: hypothetical protein VGM74_19235 [Burkholderiaceae bacterium]